MLYGTNNLHAAPVLDNPYEPLPTCSSCLYQSNLDGWVVVLGSGLRILDTFHASARALHERSQSHLDAQSRTVIYAKTMSGKVALE